MSNFTRVYFPGLGIDFDLPSVAFTIGSYDIHFYGIIIAFGFMLAVLYGGRMAYKWRMSLDGMTDVLIWGTVFGIVCARAYYVIFEWSYYSAHPAEIVQIWNGGLAIYGGIIGAFLFGGLACKWRKVPMLPMFDLAAMGFLIGQCLGRWGNFFNQEAFGCNTTLPWGMYSEATHDYLMGSTVTVPKGTIIDPNLPVHPTFLYESIWCLVGFVLLTRYIKKRKFNGDITLRYLIWYGAGRFWIEGLRTDSLYLFHWTLFGQRIRVSQALSLVMVLVCAGILVYQFKVKKADGSNLFVKRVQQTTEAEEAAAEPTAPDEKQ